MKTVKSYILEGFSSPDVFYIKNGPSVNWRMSNAYPFFYNNKTGVVVMSEDGNETHMDIFKRMYDKPETRKEMMKLFNIEAWDMSSLDDASDAMYNNETVARGRVWMLPTRQLLKYIDKGVDEARSADDIEISKNLKEMWTLFIAWWTDLGDEKSMKKGCEAVIDKIIKEYNKQLKVKEYYFIDSNGDWEIIDYSSNGDISTANLKSDEEKQVRKAIQAIHLASQKEKAEFFKAWKAEVAELKEKELQMLGIKDGTYAKRNHKFSKHVVLDKETGKYRVVYGAHIGDSLQIKPFKNYILESYNYKTVTDFVKSSNVSWDKLYEIANQIYSQISDKLFDYIKEDDIEITDDKIETIHLSAYKLASALDKAIKQNNINIQITK